MTIDARKNFAYSTVATAPSPATTGTSVVVGDASVFPAVPFNATVWPAGVQPSVANSEIVRVTNISSNTLTIDREEESTTARTIVVGDQIAATLTAKMITDIETDIAAAVPKSLFDANTVIAADADNTPAAITMAASTILARLAAGNIKAASVDEISALLGMPKRVVLASPFAINSGAADALTNITGLSFPMLNGETYWFRVIGHFTSGATGCGSRWTLTCTGTPTYLTYKSEYGLSATTSTVNGQLTGKQLPSAANGTSNVSNGATNLILIEGLITASQDDTFQVQGARELTSNTLTVLAGAAIEYRKVA